jgi:hypothetical protein
MLRDTYLQNLKKRAKESRAYTKFQLVGLEIANILKDQKHKALYIRLAKTGDADQLLRVAKEVADRGNVRNKGAYFMRLVVSEQVDGLKKKTKLDERI